MKEEYDALTPPEADCPLDNLFHSCALAAYIEAARLCGGWPVSEAVRQIAFALYERELANLPPAGPRLPAAPAVIGLTEAAEPFFIHPTPSEGDSACSTTEDC